MRQLTWLFGLQALLWACVLGLSVWRAGAVMLRAQVDTPVFLAALRPRLHSGDVSGASRLAQALLPAWVASIAQLGLASWADRNELAARLEERLSELERDLGRHVLQLRTLGRISPPIAFVCAIAQMSAGARHDLGLLALQRGLAESVAIERAMLCVVTGMVTALLCRVSATLLQRHERVLHADVAKTADLVLSAALERAQ